MRGHLRLKPGTKIWFEGEQHQVTGIVDGTVRLRSDCGVSQLILAGELLGAESFRPWSPDDAYSDLDPPGPDTAALLEGLSDARKTELLAMQAHLLEMTTGHRSGQASDALDGEPRPEYARL